LEGTTFKLHLNSLCEDGAGPGLETVGGEFQPSFETVYPGAGAHHSFFHVDSMRGEEHPIAANTTTGTVA